MSVNSLAETDQRSSSRCTSRCEMYKCDAGGAGRIKKLAISDLPNEVLEQVMIHAGKRHRRAQLLDWCTYGPATRQLHRDVVLFEPRQVEGVLAGFEREGGERLAAAVHRLHIDISDDEDRVTVARAIEVMEWVPSTRVLHLESTSSTEYDLLYGALHTMTLLNRVELSLPTLSLTVLASMLRVWPRLTSLKVHNLVSGTGEEEEIAMDALPEKMSLGDVTLINSALNDYDLIALLKPSTQSLRALAIRTTRTLSRRALFHILSFLGTGLHVLEVRDIHLPDEDSMATGLETMMDRVAALCPFLLEFAMATDQICSKLLLTQAIILLPLRHLELDCRLPRLEPKTLLETLERIPVGRLETLLIGPAIRWHDDDIENVKRTCDRLGIFFSRQQPDEDAEQDGRALTHL